MKKFLPLFSLAFVLLMVGCAAPMKAPVENDASAKVFKPLNDKASLFIFRNENYGGAVGMPIKINGLDIGETGAKTFFRLNLASGMYVITSEAENTSELPLNLIEGRNYFVWQEARMGIWKARTALRSVDEKTGMNGVLESVLLTPRVSDDLLSKTAIVKK
jgi:hypothetical protein